MHILNTLPQRLDSGATPTFTGALFTDNVTAPDLILGTSGPSAKSSIAARAARQGLVFTGTGSGFATMGSSLGTSSGTIDIVLDIPSSNPSVSRGVFTVGPNTSSANFGNCLSSELRTDGKLWITLTGTTANDYRRVESSSSLVSLFGGKKIRLTVVRDSSALTLTVYTNGILLATAESTAGTPLTWSGSVTGTYFVDGGVSSSETYVGYHSLSGFYNRALSAAEVVSLYEAGMPAGADYNTASNTNAITTIARNSDFSAGATDWTGSSATATVTASKLDIVISTNGSRVYLDKTFITGWTAGYNKRWRLTADITNYSVSGGAVVQIVQGTTGTVSGTISGNGTFSVELTNTNGNVANGQEIQIRNTGTTGTATLTIDNIVIVPIGLLLAPDAAQSGGGLTWYDTSGNAANITLPATGVSWNVPTSGRGIFADGTAAAPSISFAAATNMGLYRVGPNDLGVSIGGAYSFIFGGSGTLYGANGTARLTMPAAGSVGLVAAGTNQNITLTPSGTGFVSALTGGGYSLKTGATGAVFAVYTTGATVQIGTESASPLDFFTSAGATQMRLQTNGRFLLGTTTDSGALLQIGTNTTTSAGGMVFGTDTFLYRVGGNALAIDAVGGGNSGLYFRDTGSTKAIFSLSSGDLLIDTATAGKNIYFRSGNQALALTLDSSQNATFAGTVKSSVSTGSRTIQSTPTVTVAPDAVQNLVSQNYGFFLVNENVLTGSIAIIGFNSGGTYIVWQEGTNYSTTANTASKFNVYYSAGTQLVVQNKKASNATFNIINLAGGS